MCIRTVILKDTSRTKYLVLVVHETCVPRSIYSCIMTLRGTFDFYTNLTLWFYLISIHRYFGVPDATFVSLALASKYFHEHHTFVRTQLFCVYILCANFHMKIQTQKS